MVTSGKKEDQGKGSRDTNLGIKYVSYEDILYNMVNIANIL